MAFDYTAGKAGQISKVANDTEVKAAKTYNHTDLFMTGRPLGLGQMGTDNAYSSSWIAYSCIKRLATDAAGVPLLFLSDPNDPDSAVPDTHPTRALFNNPSPYFSQSELIQWLVTMLNMRGEFFVPFDNLIRPTMMIPQTDANHWKNVVDGIELIRWEYRNQGNSMMRMPDELIHHGLVNPAKPFRGQSPLMAAAKAFGIEQGSDKLTLSLVNRGGERSIMFMDKTEATEQQLEQAAAKLRARHQRSASVPADVILPGGLEPIDPSFGDDETAVLEAGASQPDKICAVYGVPKSMLGFGSEEKYSNAQVKKRMYFENTVVPMLTGITDSFDRMFVSGALGARYNCYVRFDWKSVPAMQDNLTERFELAGKAHKDGLPWSVLNQRFELGLPVEEIPGANTIMVSSGLAPLEELINEWKNPPKAEPAKAAEQEITKAELTNAVIRKRASDTRATIQRNMRLLEMEKEFRAEWKKVLTPVMNKAAKAAGQIKTASGARAALKPAFKGLGEKLAKVATPRHEAAALEGEQAILELVDGKMSDSALNMFKQVHQWSPDVRDFLRDRKNLIVKFEDTLFADVLDSVEDAVIDGKGSADVQHVVRKRMASAPGGINRAVTIARTEVGTAYNVARYSEIKNQDFAKHEWITNDDDVVRDTHVTAGNAGPVKVGDDFPGVNLPYPQAPSGPAEEVINCRCETIPMI